VLKAVNVEIALVVDLSADGVAVHSVFFNLTEPDEIVTGHVMFQLICNVTVLDAVAQNAHENDFDWCTLCSLVLAVALKE
jgi:hypothetical protein